MFTLKRPNDLVALLKQEELSQNVSRFLDEMIQRKIKMDQKWSNMNSVPEVEHELMSTDEDCIEAKNSVEDGDLYMNVIDYGSETLM